MTEYSSENPRRYHWQDKLITSVSKCIRSVFDLPQHSNLSLRTNPAETEPENALTESERKLSAALMRINHTGEVCAQALYFGQSLTAREHAIQQKLKLAANEEQDHLNWCKTRLDELNSRASLLNPFWYSASFVMGAVVGLAGDQWNLGFLAETENQVYQHLSTHLEKLPVNDLKSKAIVTTMRQDEAKHATTAMDCGARDLPFPVQLSMRWMAKVMTSITYYV